MMIFPDYTLAVQMQCRSYDQVEQKLWAINLCYMLLYPAKLKVINAEKSFFFTSLEEAWMWATEQTPIPSWGLSAVLL